MSTQMATGGVSLAQGQKRGQLLQPEDEGYDSARHTKSWRKAIPTARSCSCPSIDMCASLCRTRMKDLLACLEQHSDTQRTDGAMRYLHHPPALLTVDGRLWTNGMPCRVNPTRLQVVDLTGPPVGGRLYLISKRRRHGD